MTKLVEGLVVDSPELQKPFRLIVAGGSGSGKSCFVQKLVETNHFNSSFKRIRYIYPDYLDECPMEFDTDLPVTSTSGLPSCSSLSSIESNSLVILDDLMLEVAKCDDIARLFTVIARKKNISVVLIVQNIFQQGKAFRNIRLSATHIVLFKFYAGVSSNYRLLREVGLSSFIPKKLMEEIYSTKFNYIYLDLHPNRHNDFSSVRSNIFDKYSSVYYEMEYVAIPKADFMKYFKIIEANKGQVKAIKNEVKITTSRREGKSENKRQSKRRRTPTPPPASPECSDNEQIFYSDTDESEQ